MNIKRIAIAAAIAGMTWTLSFAEESMDHATGQVDTYLTILETEGGKKALSQIMVNEYRKSVRAAVDAVDQMSARRFQALIDTYKGTEFGEELGENAESARERYKLGLANEERVVTDTILATFETMSDEEIRTLVSQVSVDLQESAAQNFSVGDVLKKIVGGIARVVGVGGFFVGAAIKFPVVFTYHFLTTAVRMTAEKSGKAWKGDWAFFKGTIFSRYIGWVGKQLGKEAKSWDDFMDRWRREIPEN